MRKTKAMKLKLGLNNNGMADSNTNLHASLCELIIGKVEKIAHFKIQWASPLLK